MTVLTDLFAQIKKRDPNQAPFHQAVEEVFQSLDPFLAKNPKYIQQGCWSELSNLSVSLCSVSLGWTTKAEYRSTAVTVYR